MTITKEKFGIYEGKWVALNKKNEEVLSSGKSMKEVVKKLKGSRKSGILFMYISPFNAYLAPTAGTNGF